MLVHMALCNIQDSANQPIHSRVRFIYKDGTAAVWSEDLDTKHVTRLDRLTGTTFSRRRIATRPHTLTLADDTVWNIWPLNTGGCGSCGSRVANFSYDELLSPDLVSL
jgi:hypothetical protein